MPATHLLRAFAVGFLLYSPWTSQSTVGDPARQRTPDSVKVAAVQICGYDKGDVPREEYDPTDAIIPYVHRAGRDGAQLVVFLEYVLGRIPVPGPATNKLAAAAAANQIYVSVGCRELIDDHSFANFQSHVAMIATNQAYGSGTMIAENARQIVQRCPDKTEAWISATLDLKRIRLQRANSRNFQQRRPDLYSRLSQPLPNTRSVPDTKGLTDQPAQ